MTSILILNANGELHLDRCIESVVKHTSLPRYELIVVDNGSTDGSMDYLMGLRMPNLTVVSNPKNLGCPTGRAQGMALSVGRHICLLDNDTVVTPHWLERLAAHLDRDPTRGVVGPITNYAGGIQGYGSQGAPTDAMYEAGLDYHADELYIQGAELETRLRQTSRLIGFCMLIDRRVVDAIGSIDGSFGKYGFEDDDYTWRARCAGFRPAVDQRVDIHHTGGAGQAASNVDYSEEMGKGWAQFSDKWGLPDGMTFEDYCDLTGRFELIEPDADHHFIPMMKLSEVCPLIAHRTERTPNG